MRISDWSSDVCSSDLPRLPQGRAGIMANADKPATDPVPQTPETAEASATPESRREVGRRNLNHQIAQRQKALLAGVGAIARGGGAAFLFNGDDDRHAGASGHPVTIERQETRR